MSQEVIESCYKSLGLVGYHYRLSKHDSNKVSELEGSLENWLIGENILRECLIEMNLDFYEEAGEAAFYGPKIDIQMKFGKYHSKPATLTSRKISRYSSGWFSVIFSRNSIMRLKAIKKNLSQVYS
ncbi:MAG: hypothetical protein Q7U04_10640 [Bacteriovorax sp.]|nr:hypothetical protein [Bacteriovorax sp.]